jgi:hypothetical protein
VHKGVNIFVSQEGKKAIFKGWWKQNIGFGRICRPLHVCSLDLNEISTYSCQSNSNTVGAHLHFNIVHVWIDAEGQVAGQSPRSGRPGHHADTSTHHYAQTNINGSLPVLTPPPLEKHSQREWGGGLINTAKKLS